MMRSFPRALRFWTALVLLFYWSAIHVAPASAGLVPSQPSGVTAIASQRDADVVAVQRALEHRIVAQKLLDYGVRPDEVRARLDRLSDADLHTLASASKGLPSGADDGLGLIIGLLVVVLLVILILKLMNKEVIVR
jgi:hypothetical protein